MVRGGNEGKETRKEKKMKGRKWRVEGERK